jgi:uncharacterized phage protein gp47/JayE
MPIENGEYVERTEGDIITLLRSELRDQFGADIDLTESSVFTNLAQTIAAVLNENQEASLKDVYQSAFLDTATGTDLERVVSILGLSRRGTVNSTGVQRFYAGSKVRQDFSIQKGTIIQTRGTSPTQFETTESVALRLFDSFEDGDISEYSGSTGNATVINNTADSVDGDYHVELDATDGAHIYRDDITVKQGSTLHCHTEPTANTEPAITFALDPQSADNHYQVRFDLPNDRVRLERVDGGTATALDTLSGAGLSGGTYYEAKIDWNITDNIGVTIIDIDADSEVGTLGAVDSTYQSGNIGLKSSDSNGTKKFDWYTSSAVSSNIRSIRGGQDSNVGANTIVDLPSPPAGVDTATNLYSTGDDAYEDRDGNTFVFGRDEETDASLRERAENTVTGGGDATHDALVSALVNEVIGVSSVTIFQNKTATDNTGSGGLPPHSFEAVVFGGTDQDVAEAIFETKAITANDYGGANGTAVNQSVTADSNSQTRTIQFSRPAKLSVDLTLDLVIDDSYIGDDEVRDKIVRYIGGTTSNSNEVEGLGVNENVRIDRIRDIVVGDENGVIGFDENVDGDVVEATPSTTTVNGLIVIDVGSTEVAQTDATDASITLNTRTI